MYIISQQLNLKPLEAYIFGGRIFCPFLKTFQGGTFCWRRKWREDLQSPRSRTCFLRSSPGLALTDVPQTQHSSKQAATHSQAPQDSQMGKPVLPGLPGTQAMTWNMHRQFLLLASTSGHKFSPNLPQTAVMSGNHKQFTNTLQAGPEIQWTAFWTKPKLKLHQEE